MVATIVGRNRVLQINRVIIALLNLLIAVIKYK